MSNTFERSLPGVFFGYAVIFILFCISRSVLEWYYVHIKKMDRDIARYDVDHIYSTNFTLAVLPPLFFYFIGYFMELLYNNIRF